MSVLKKVHDSFLAETRHNELEMKYPISHIQILLRMKFNEAELLLRRLIDCGAVCVVSENTVLINENIDVSESTTYL